jgi:hypothetical protein
LNDDAERYPPDAREGLSMDRLSRKGHAVVSSDRQRQLALPEGPPKARISGDGPPRVHALASHAEPRMLIRDRKGIAEWRVTGSERPVEIGSLEVLGGPRPRRDDSWVETTPASGAPPSAVRP